MSAIRYIGNHDITSEGKFLMEILAQLKQFGVGRYVTKNEWGRKWPDQPSYLRLVRVQPTMDRWLFGGRVFAEWTFRGKNLGVYEFDQNLNRSDWRLIHKHEEEKFKTCSEPLKEINFPKSFPLPPLQILLSKKNAEKNGQGFTTRAPLTVCIDPEFRMLEGFIKQVDPKNKSTSIYDEVDEKALLDLYGNEIPVKVEAWNVGAAAYKRQYC